MRPQHVAQANLACIERIYKAVASRARLKGSRSGLRKEMKRFRSVAHLWAAWSIRDGNFSTCPELGYDGWLDFQFFVAEAEILRDFGQWWHLCVPNIRFSLDGEDRRGKFLTR